MNDDPKAPGGPLPRRDDATPGAVPTILATSHHGILVRARKWMVDRMVAKRSERAKAILQKNTALWDLMTRAAAGTTVTGASCSDYLTLYEQV